MSEVISNAWRALQLRCGHDHAWIAVVRDGEAVAVCMGCNAVVSTPRRAVVPVEPAWRPGDRP